MDMNWNYQGISLFLLDTEYFQVKPWFKQVQHLFTRNRSLNNAFKHM